MAVQEPQQTLFPLLFHFSSRHNLDNSIQQFWRLLPHGDISPIIQSYQLVNCKDLAHLEQIIMHLNKNRYVSNTKK